MFFTGIGFSSTLSPITNLYSRHQELNKRTKMRSVGHGFYQQLCHKNFCCSFETEILEFFKLVDLQFSVRCRFLFARYIDLNVLFLTESKTSLCIA